MQHFSSQRWADFVRNVSGDEEKAAMLAHLETGCKQCSKALGAWTHILEAARRARAYEPPESAVRMAKALLPTRSRLSQVGAAVAQVLFDSFTAPAFAGARSGAAAPRQMLYGIGDYRIDLRLEQKPGTEKISILGQILVSTDHARPAAGLRAILVSGDKTITSLHTNEFGEFEVECEPVPNPKLKFVLEQQVEVAIPLSDTPSGARSKFAEVSESKGPKTKRKHPKRTRKRA